MLEGKDFFFLNVILILNVINKNFFRLFRESLFFLNVLVIGFIYFNIDFFVFFFVDKVRYLCFFDILFVYVCELIFNKMIILFLGNLKIVIFMFCLI